MYHGAIILHPHRRINHLRTVHLDFKEQIYDHGTIGLFHLLTLTSKWLRPELLEKYKYSSRTRLYFNPNHTGLFGWCSTGGGGVFSTYTL